MPLFISFLCGFFGGTTTTLLELAGKAQVNDLPSSGFYLAMAIFGLIGGATAIIYKEMISHKAFLMGVGAPALIATAGSIADNKVSNLGDLLPVSSAYAQDFVVPAESAAEALKWDQALEKGKLVVVPIEPIKFGGASIETNAQLNYQTPNISGSVPLFSAADFNKTYGVDLKNLEKPYSWYAILPDDSTSTSLSGNLTTYGQSGSIDIWQVETENVTIPDTEGFVKFDFEKKPNFWSGFYDAFGMDNLARKNIEYPASIETKLLSLEELINLESGQTE